MARRSLHSNILSCLLGLTAAGSPSFAGVDNASRYSGTNAPVGWIAGGHRGDVEFGFWEFEAVANGGAAGRFLGDSSLVGAGGSINTGGQAFGLFAHPPQATAPVAAAIRKFAKPALTTGDTLSFQLAVNYRNGTKGFTLRNATGTSQWNFSVGRVDGSNDGYYIRNGVSGSAFDNGQRFGGYSENTVFTFTFTQRERQLQWTAVRSGGISATVSGNLPVDSGTIADLRFFITGTESSATEPRNNLYFNNLSLTTESRGDAPLTIGERRTPGVVPSYLLRFSDPNVLNTVTVRHGGDWNTSYSLTNAGGGVWSIDIRNVLAASNNSAPISSGWHEFKFRTNSVFEGGENRLLYIDSLGRVAAPPAVYLTWQRDPTTTMTAHWHNFSNSFNALRWRTNGGLFWNTLTATSTNAPVGDRLVHTAEITNLAPGGTYEFQVDGYTNTFSFRTMPSDLTQPVKFAVAGDADTGPDADAMAAAIAAKDPAFVAMIGDHAYEDSRAANFWMWERYLQSYFTNLRAPDGRLIPVVAGLGNHEIYNGWAEFHPDFDNTADWRLRYGSYLFRYFAFPGAAQPYGVLDFGSYLSLIVLDTEHSSPFITGSDAQTQWLSARLSERRNVKHLLPMYHVPAYPSVRASSDPIPARIRAQWVPLFENAGVYLAFENHDHAYKRTKPLLGGVTNSDGIVFAGDGAWGVELRAPDATRTYLQGAQARHHAFLVTISNTGRTIEAVDKTGVVFDSFSQGIDGIPSAPITPSLVNLATNSASFTWTPVSNATNYAILRNGTQIGTTTSTNFTDSAWSPSSGASYQVVANNRAGSFTNNSSAPGARQVWNVTNNFPWNGTGEGAATADPDADGIANLAEYFHGLNPRTADAATDAFVNTISSDSVGVRYRVNPGATGVQGRVERTADLLAAPWTTDGLSTNDLTGPWAGWRSVSLPIEGGASQGFLRLIISE
jgi:hypothetical protein